MLAAALWSLRSAHWRATKKLAACASWPAWMLGFVLLDYSRWLMPKRPHHWPRYRIETVQAALDTLTDARWLLLATGVVTLIALHRQLRRMPTKALRALCAGTFIIGVVSFAATRSMAHDAKLVMRLTGSEVYGNSVPDVAELPAGHSCQLPKDEAVVIELTPQAPFIDGNRIYFDEEIPEFIEDRIELWRRFNPGRPLTMRLRLLTHPDISTQRQNQIDQYLAGIIKRHPTVTIEHLFVRRLPPIQARTLDHPIERAQRCVLPTRLR